MTPDELVKLKQARALAASGAARALRLATGLSQEDVAECIGTCPATISHWEHGNRRPYGVRAVRWIQLLERLAPTERQ